MTKIKLLIFLLFVHGCAATQDEVAPEPNLVPDVQELVLNSGILILDETFTLCFDEENREEAQFLHDWLKGVFRLDLKMHSGEVEGAAVCLTSGLQGENPEAYQLDISEDRVKIFGTTNRGVFWGIQTLRQLFPPHVEAGSAIAVLPQVHIEDAPQFKHRGMLLDVCRHFMDKEFVKRYIDLLAYHKMNVLHWHLTEDQGWRIEIKKYPKLTQVGAWRTEADGSVYGGFYTQDDIREIVDYAAARHVGILPEIELPGHSSAALAAYPGFSCTGDSIEVETEWGVFKDIYCAGNDQTLEFLKDVLAEVMELFPSPYIHIGGDEAPKFRWEHCEKCQKRIKEEGLGDEHALQSWFIGEIGKFLTDHGRIMVGWDEILEGGLPDGAVVQSWRGMQGGVDAVKMGHQVIMSPTSHCYFDYGLASTNMEEVYDFDPIPDALSLAEAGLVMGGECNMWTERVPQESVDSKVFPRILALSEVLWKYPNSRDYEAFQKREQVHLRRLEALGVDYGFETVPVEFEEEIKSDHIELTVLPRVSDLELSWREEGKEDWQPYTEPFVIQSRKDLQFRARARGVEYPEKLESHHVFHQGLGEDFELDYVYSDYYRGGGDSALLDGALGSLDFRDGHWQGIQGGDIDIAIDFGEYRDVADLEAGFYQYNNAWIFLPTSVEFLISLDGKTWITATESVHTISPKEDGKLKYVFSASGNWRTRFVRMKAYNFGVNPGWSDSPGMPTWLFCDEFVVK